MTGQLTGGLGERTYSAQGHHAGEEDEALMQSCDEHTKAPVERGEACTTPALTCPWMLLRGLGQDKSPHRPAHRLYKKSG